MTSRREGSGQRLFEHLGVFAVVLYEVLHELAVGERTDGGDESLAIPAIGGDPLH